MSDAYAIAAVTAVLRLRLKRRLVQAQVSSVLGNVEVSSAPPDSLFPPGTDEKTQLNLYLHSVAPNPGWANEGWPVRNQAGERTSAPPMGLNLHYILTAFGKSAYHAEILIGHAMSLMHEQPVLTREVIEGTLSPNPPDPSIPQELRDAGLERQVELIKLAPERYSTEESSKFWSAMQSSFRLSMGYMASVVLIESKVSTKTALPVAERGVTGTTISSPRIDVVESEAGPSIPIDSTSTLVIRGAQLEGNATLVVLGEIEYTPPPQDLGEEEIRVPLASLPSMPRAGARGVQVMQHEDLGDPPLAHRVFGSNVGAFLLRPRITIGSKTQSATTVNGVVQVGGKVTVQFDPRVGREQRAYLLLNEFGTPAGRSARAYRFSAPTHNGIANSDPDTDSITFDYQGVVQGSYLLRVLVDGAMSELGTNAQGVFSTPKRSFG